MTPRLLAHLPRLWSIESGSPSLLCDIGHISRSPCGQSEVQAPCLPPHTAHDFLVPSRFSFSSLVFPFLGFLGLCPCLICAGNIPESSGNSLTPRKRVLLTWLLKRFSNTALMPPSGCVPKQIILSRPKAGKSGWFTLPLTHVRHCPRPAGPPCGQSSRPGPSRRQMEQSLNWPGAEGLTAEVQWASA